jgi:Holliday junction resolvasome RuvABC DNA-binding subunit
VRETAVPDTRTTNHQRRGNDHVAALLERVADLLEEREENVFRVRSYRRAARVLRRMERPVAELLGEEGTRGLEGLEGVGTKLAASIREIVETGRLALLEELRSDASPTAVLQRVPGVGPELARRIHSQLDVWTLEDLEQAAHDGRLRNVEGVGAQRLEGIRNALAGLLSPTAARSARRRQEDGERRGPAQARPEVGLLLAVDADYRRKAREGRLRKIAPRRFNPRRERWLPVMSVEREGWSLDALFSNTARSHDLGKTDDWVVIYYERDGVRGQCTVITAERGPLAGRRIVRGRERESRAWYDSRRERSPS